MEVGSDRGEGVADEKLKRWRGQLAELLGSEAAAAVELGEQRPGRGRQLGRRSSVQGYGKHYAWTLYVWRKRHENDAHFVSRRYLDFG